MTFISYLQGLAACYPKNKSLPDDKDALSGPKLQSFLTFLSRAWPSQLDQTTPLANLPGYFRSFFTFFDQVEGGVQFQREIISVLSLLSFLQGQPSKVCPEYFSQFRELLKENPAYQAHLNLLRYALKIHMVLGLLRSSLVPVIREFLEETYILESLSNQNLVLRELPPEEKRAIQVELQRVVRAYSPETLKAWRACLQLCEDNIKDPSRGENSVNLQPFGKKSVCKELGVLCGMLESYGDWAQSLVEAGVERRPSHPFLTAAMDSAHHQEGPAAAATHNRLEF